MPSKTWKLHVTLKVDDSWVADGFDATASRIEEALVGAILPAALNSEKRAEVKVLVAPRRQAILKLQGYSPERIEAIMKEERKAAAVALKARKSLQAAE